GSPGSSLFRTIQFTFSATTSGLFNVTVILLAEGSVNSVFYDVSDQQSPEVAASTNNLNYEETSIDNIISWDVFDVSPLNYSIYHNNTGGVAPILNQSWLGNTSFSINVDGGLGNNIYNYTLIVQDEFGLINKSTILVQVLPNDGAPRIIVSPSNSTNSENTQIVISYFAIDNSARNYIVYSEPSRIIFRSGNWISGETNTIDLSVLSLGTHNFTLVLFDSIGNNISTYFKINIIDNQSPIIILNPVVNNILSWTVIDNNPNVFTIYLNGTSTGSTAWVSGIPITYSLSSLSVGGHNITLEVSDSTGNYATNSYLYQLDSIHTLIPLIQLENNVNEGDSQSITGTWYESSNEVGIPFATIDVYIDDDLYDIFNTNQDGQFEFVLFYDDLSIGDHQIRIEFLKDDYQGQVVLLDITISPIEYNLEFDMVESLNQGQEYSISIYAESINTLFIPFSVRLFDELYYNPIINVNVSVVIFGKLLDNTEFRYLLFGFTDNEGKVILVLSSEQTENILEIYSIYGYIDNPFFAYQEIYVPSNQIPEIQIVGYENNLRMLVGNPAIFTLLVVLFILTFLLLLIFIIWYLRRSRALANKYAILVSESNLEIEFLKKIKQIILRDQNGIPIYQEKFQSSSTDVSLITGISTAITTFLDELNENKAFGFEIIQRQGISILSHKLENSTLILISESEIPSIFLQTIKDSHLKIEKEFGEVIKKQYFQADTNFSEGVSQIFEEEELKIGLIRGFNIIERDMKIRNKFILKDKFKIQLYEQIQYLIDEIEMEDIHNLNTLYNKLLDTSDRVDWIPLILMEMYEEKIIIPKLAN
ncbi:MAG: hypothetical protein OEZ01_15040, partial [Candidatus Heimdallarchaeota archaeon]|nr:hypothetical protein [Candidatus Heimdallarchaeota archaeon]